MLREILRIKKIREQSSFTELKKCEYRLEQAVIDLEKKKNSLVEYIEWRSKEEITLYDNILNTQVKQNSIDILKHNIAKLREHDLELQEYINNAESHLNSCKDALQQAKQKHAKAQKDVEKFEVFSQEIEKEEERKREMLNELEMEEFSNKKKYY